VISIRPAKSLDEKTDYTFYPYKSEEDKSIADMLTSYNIPFFYKQPTLVIENGKRCIEYADFFLPTYNGLAIDYIIESNSAIYRRKKNVYQDNQMPAVLITRRDMARPGWQKKLYQKLEAIDRSRSGYHPHKHYG
jgi:hypothetical protein